MDSTDAFDIQDIRREEANSSLSELLTQGLKGEPPSLPDLLLWNENGLKQFEAITYTPEYYLTGDEIKLLEAHSASIASKLVPDSILVELGSGCLRKTGILLQAFEDIGKPVDYYALDLDKSELERSLAAIRPSRFHHVRLHALLGTYEDGFAWMARENIRIRPRTVLTLGSTLGGFPRGEAATFLGNIADLLNEDAPDFVVVGLDGCTDGNRVWRAYNDDGLKNETFILNALDHAHRLTGDSSFKQEHWQRIGEWNEQAHRHEQYLVPRKDLHINGQTLKAGTRIVVAYSHKYDAEQRHELWEEAGVTMIENWETNGYGLYLLSPEPSSQSTSPG